MAPWTMNGIPHTRPSPVYYLTPLRFNVSHSCEPDIYFLTCTDFAKVYINAFAEAIFNKKKEQTTP